MADVREVLRGIAKKVNDQTKLEVAKYGDEILRSNVDQWIPTKSPLLNLLCGEEDYGLPCGRIIELFGDYSHGKSTIAQIMMNAFQEAGGISVLLDAEAAWNKTHAVQIGHNSDRHLSIEVDTCERGFEVMQNTLDKFQATFGGKIPLIFVWDTLAASPTEDEIKNDEFGSGMTYKPRLIRMELKKLTPKLHANKAMIVFVNQTIENIKAKVYTKVKTTPGGGGVKFWSSIRLQVEKVADYFDREDKDKNAGIISKVTAVKHKLHPPFREIDIPLSFATGVDPVREVANYLLDNTKIYNVNGSYKKIVGFGDKGDISFYEKDIEMVMKNNPGLYEYMVEKVKEHWLTGSTS